MCSKKYNPPEMLPYGNLDRENALRLAAQERWDMMLSGRRSHFNGHKKERRSAK